MSGSRSPVLLGSSSHNPAEAIDEERFALIMAPRRRRSHRTNKPQEKTTKEKKGPKRILEGFKRCCLRFLKAHFPAATWMPNYKRAQLQGDIVAGCTVAVLMIPQSISYSALAGLAPEYGIYSSIFPVAVYALLGSSRHMHIGPFAVVSLLVATACEDLLGRQGPVYTGHDDPEYVGLAVQLCLLVGSIQLLCGVFRLGFLTLLLSEPVVSGVTTAAACFVVTSQMKQLFGVLIPSFLDPGSLFKIYMYLLTHHEDANKVSLAIGLIGVVALLLLRRVNDQYQLRLRVPLPSELIVVLIATALSYACDFEHNYRVKVVGTVQGGLPVPTLPVGHTTLPWSALMPSALTIAVVSYIVSISIVKTFGSRLGYETDSNQEFIALGGANLVGSLFSCYPASGSLSRSAVLVAAGGNTPLACMISAAIMVVVVLALIPLFSPMPHAILASVILVALQGMLMQYRLFFQLLPINKIDAFMWLASFLLTLVFNVGPGVGASVVLNLLLVAVSKARPEISELGWVKGTTLYRDLKRYEGLVCFPGIKIIRFNSPLSYMNCDVFYTHMIKHATTVPPPASEDDADGVDNHDSDVSGSDTDSADEIDGHDVTKPFHSYAAVQSDERVGGDIGEAAVSSSNGVRGHGDGAGTRDTATPASVSTPVRWIVLDCGGMPDIDYTGLQQLTKTHNFLLTMGTRMVLAGARGNVRDSLMKNGCLKEGIQSFVSIHAAVSHCLHVGDKAEGDVHEPA